MCAHSFSRKEMLNRSPRQVPNSGGGPGVWPGQYAPQDDSAAFAAVWKANSNVLVSRVGASVRKGVTGGTLVLS